MSAYRRSVQIRSTNTSRKHSALDVNEIQAFHRSLPHYTPSRLVALPQLAENIGVRGVYIKDESERLGTSSFKILGASWGIFQALKALGQLGDDANLKDVAAEAVKQRVKLFAATDGNHGRAVARIAKMLSLEAYIYVPRGLDDHAKDRILGEGPHLVVCQGDYDNAVQEADQAAKDTPNGVLIQDTAFPGYEDIPSAIVDGYSTIFAEIDDELEVQSLQTDAIFTPVGVGSLASAVVQYYKAKERPDTKVIAVEPDTAACLYQSLQKEAPTKISTSHTIMTGMNCGSVTSTGWEKLSKYIDASITVSDFEAHRAVQYLDTHHVSSGPCGASGLAALSRLSPEDRANLGLNNKSVIVLLNTEGTRPYEIPLDVSTDDAVQLTQILTQIESTNPTLSPSKGSGETQIADYIESWLQHRGIQSRRLESISGRPSITGVVPGKSNGKNLMLNGHIDTVSISNYDSNPLSGDLMVKDGREVVVGRGCLDMKAGVAVAMTALSRASRMDLSGDVILAAVADEEDRSKGTEDILDAGLRVDAAIVTEPTMLTLGTGHKGFVWLEIEVIGFSAHGSNSDAGVDAILNAGLVLNSLRDYSQTLPSDDFLGQSTLHCGLISGGEELSTYPSSCNIKIELRTIPGQEPDSIKKEISELLAGIAKKELHFKYKEPRVLFYRAAYRLESNHPFEQVAIKAAEKILNKKVTPQGLGFWCDAALLAGKGIPTVVFGPEGQGLHASEEWVDVESIRKTEEMINYLIDDFCG